MSYLFEEDNKHEKCIHCGRSSSSASAQPSKKVSKEVQHPTLLLKEGDKSNIYNPTNHPIYGKFFKMISMGVPKPAVKQKIVMSGLNPEIITNPKLLKWKTNKKVKSNSSKKQSRPINPLFQGIAMGKMNLKKTKPIKKKKSFHSKLGLTVPSLDDILGALKRLKSTKII